MLPSKRRLRCKVSLDVTQTRMHKQRVTDKKEIGLRLRAARKAAKLTMKQLSARINVCVGTLSSVELGTITMTHTLDYHVKLICQELDIGVEQIMY